MAFLSKTISQYIGTNLATYFSFLVLSIFIFIFLLRSLKKVKNKFLKFFLLVFIISFLGLSIFPYGLFNETISLVHQIFADVAFISSFIIGIILFLIRRRGFVFIFILYALTFILMYIIKFPPFRETELVWESLYFVLFGYLLIEIQKN